MLGLIVRRDTIANEKKVFYHLKSLLASFTRLYFSHMSSLFASYCFSSVDFGIRILVSPSASSYFSFAPIVIVI